MNIHGAGSTASKTAFVGWLAGLAYYSWFAAPPISAPFWGYVVLIAAGGPVVSMVVGIIMTIIGETIARTIARKSDARPIAFAFAFFVPPVVAFFAAERGLQLFAR